MTVDRATHQDTQADSGAPRPDPLVRYRTLAARMADVADQVAPGRWQWQSPCDQWSTVDVLDHVIDTQRDFLGRMGLDLDALVASDDPATRWTAHVDVVADVLDRPGVADTPYDSLFGPSTLGATLARFHGFDLVVHRWDLGRGAGVEVTFTDDELDLLDDSIAAFGEHLYTEGVCQPAIPVPDDAGRQARLLATMGRDPAFTPTG